MKGDRLRPDVRALDADDVEALIALRRRALTEEPAAFGASVEDAGVMSERLTSAVGETARSAVFGAFLDGRLVGMAGVIREHRPKTRHKALVWGMFVAPEARGSGVGRALLDAAVARAREWEGVVQVHLSVTDRAPAAMHLYGRAGFREWGREPRALRVDGAFVEERHLVLDLDA